MHALAIYVIFVYVISICIYTNIQKNIYIHVYIQKHTYTNFVFGGGENGTMYQSIAGDHNLRCETLASETCFNIDPGSLWKECFMSSGNGHCWGSIQEKINEKLWKCGGFFLHKKQNN